MTDYVAKVPADFDAMVATVKRQAEEECANDQLSPPLLDRCVREAVEVLRGSRIRTFVPLFALRRVRCCVRARTCACDDW